MIYKYMKPLEQFDGIPTRNMTEAEWEALNVPAEIKTAALELGVYAIDEDE